MDTTSPPALIGRFAPVCDLHLEAVKALVEAHGRVVVVLTDAAASRQSRFPWTSQEREDMFKVALGPFADQVTFRSVDDQVYRPDVQASSRALACGGGATTTADTRPLEESLCAAWFAGDRGKVADYVPEAVLDWMKAFRAHESFPRLVEEAAYVADYLATWRALPWPPTFVTVDTFITCAGSLLLVKRGGQPGRGMWALPGGFVDQKEWLVDAAIRELREETGLHLSDEMARDCLRHQTVFDDPWRSARGRTVTHGFHFDLPGPLPEVEGADDAQAAVWWPIEDLGQLRGLWLEDHGQMIDYFLHQTEG